MTFEEFAAARTPVADVAVAARYADSHVEGEPRPSQRGWTYPTGFYIVDVGDDWPEAARREGAHYLILGNQEWIDDDLGRLERILYESNHVELSEDDA